MEKTCIICGKIFEGNGKEKVCSDECRFKRRRQTQRNHALSTGKFTLKHKTCKVCGKEFETYRGNQVTCGEECSKKNNLEQISNYGKKVKDTWNATRRERYQAKVKSENRKEICKNCGKEFDKVHKRLYCSDECEREKRKEMNGRKKTKIANDLSKKRGIVLPSKAYIKTKGRNVKMENLKVKAEITLTPEMLDDIIVTALEGGIGYWCDTYKTVVEPSNKYSEEDFTKMNVSKNATKILLNGGSLLMIDNEDDQEGDEEKYTLTLQKVLNGIGLYVAKGTLNNNHVNLCLENYDANDVDLIIQYGLFGEIVYC